MKAPHASGALADRARALGSALATPRPARSDSLVRQHLVLGAALTLAVVVAAVLLLDAPSLHDWPRPLVRVGRVITWLGNSIVWLVPSGLALIVLALAWQFRSRRGAAPAGTERLLGRTRLWWEFVWLRLAFFFVDVAASGILVNVAKRFIGRVRPHHIGDDGGILIFRLGHWSNKYASFPSGHSTTAFAVAVCVWLLFGARAGLAAVAVAVLVLASRILVGAHFPSDVLAGAMVGTVFTLAFATWLARRRLVFRETSTGGLAPRRLPRERPRLRS